MIGTAQSSSDFQRRDRLIGRDKGFKTHRIQPAIDMRDQLQRDSINAREFCPKAVGKTWQLPAVRRRQMTPGQLPNLLFDEIEIIDEPFRRGRDPPALRHRGGQQIIRIDEDAVVFIQPGNELVRQRLFPLASSWRKKRI